jgi:hypothetical protein
MNLDEYRKYIKKLADSDSENVFLNSGKDHAAIVLSTIFESADSYVHLFAGNMNGGVSSQQEYADSLFKFLAKGGELEILLSEFDASNEPKIFRTIRLAKSMGLKVEVKVTPERLVNDETGGELHFAVADDKMYRAEHDTDNFLAVGSFNDEAFTKILDAHFVELFKSAKAISIPWN